MLLKIFYQFGLKAKPNKTLQTTFTRWKIVRGDTVILRNGSDKGKQGIITKVYRKSNKVLVDGINIKYKITRSKYYSLF